MLQFRAVKVELAELCLAAFLRFLKSVLASLGWGYLAGAGFALLLVAEFAAIVGRPGFREAGWAFVSMLGVGSPLIVSVGLAYGLLTPLVVRQRSLAPALLVGLTIALSSGASYAAFFPKVPSDRAWVRIAQFAAYVFLWFLWYCLRTRRRLARDTARVQSS